MHHLPIYPEKFVNTYQVKNSKTLIINKLHNDSELQRRLQALKSQNTESEENISQQKNSHIFHEEILSADRARNR